MQRASYFPNPSSHRPPSQDTAAPPATDLFTRVLRGKGVNLLTAQFISKYCPIYLHIGPKCRHLRHLVHHLTPGLLQEPPRWSPCFCHCPLGPPHNTLSNLCKSKSERVHSLGPDISGSRPWVKTKVLTWSVRSLRLPPTSRTLSSIALSLISRLQPSGFF